MMIAAVAVVAILVGTSAYVMFLAPLRTSMSPDEITIDAGQMLGLSVSVKKGIKTLTNDDAVNYRWRLTPDTIASFNYKSRPNVNVTAGIVEAQGTLTCEVTYKGEKVTMSRQLTIKPPFLDQIIIAPSTKTLEKGTIKAFKASAVDSVGNPVLNLTYTWALSSTLATINATTGLSVNLTAGGTDGNLNLTATATWKSVTKTGTAKVIVGPLPPRKVDYLWYKMFDVPFNEWWNWRWTYYGTEKVMTTTYPYMFGFYATPEGNVKVYANSRLNITARNLTQISMGENPEFLPLHGSARGGTAVIDWYMQYLTSAEMARYPSNTAGWLDGWVVSLNGTVTLDKEAALSVIKGLSTVSFDNFNTWWQTHGTEVSNDIMGWITSEALGPRLNVYPAYDGAFSVLTGSIAGVKVGDKIVLTYDTVTWGMEAVIMRWLHETFMPTEWWFEDMYFHAVIGPEMSRIDIDTAVAYALYAFDTVQDPRMPCWVFEGMHQDVLASNGVDIPKSDFDPYLDVEYLNGAPGNAFYEEWMAYDYTPAAWNLSTNETLIFEYPSGQLPFLVHVPIDETVIPRPIFASTSATQDTMSVKFSEPNSAENSEIAPGTVSVDNAERKVVLTGPIDMWDWANNQTTYPELKDNWTRLDLLPHGLPWIEFGMEHGLVTWPDKFVAKDIPQMPVNNTPVNITVSVKDNYGRAYPEFNGTLHFEANRSDVDLPPDYTFNPAVDGGRHVFTYNVTFHGLGYYQIDMSDVSVGGNATGSYIDIWVIPEPEEVTGFELEVFGIKGLVIVGLTTSVKVTVFNQYPAPHNVFKGYNGTAVFSTDAPVGTYTLAPDTTFSPANKGMATLGGFLYNQMGTYTLTVTDSVNTSATGSASFTVAPPPEIDYRMYDMFEQPWGEWWPWRLIGWKTDMVLNNKPHEYTFVYNPDQRNLQGIIYAPYRWNVTAKNLSTLSVHDPEFMPIFGTPDVAGAAVDMHIAFQYLDHKTWEAYWNTTWHSNWNWSDAVMDAIMPATEKDGYYLGTVYTVSMNREAALEWMGMPMADDSATWWVANRAIYMKQWEDWIVNEGNIKFDIWPAYEWPYINLATLMDLVEETNGNLTLRIGHISWGYEILTVRWFTDIGLCNHEPYYEDFNLSAHYTENFANVSVDAVCQYNLHAVKANASTSNDAAWVWEPQRIDYFAPYTGTASGYVSQYTPWAFQRYTSWNSGDGKFGTYAAYDFTPQWFNLASYMTFEIQLPTGDNIIGYAGEKLVCNRLNGAIFELRNGGNASAYENITVHGPMTLGYNMTGLEPGAPNLWDSYDPLNKTLKMVGPINFDNYRFPDGLLYHSAPWIEFNVANVTSAWSTAVSPPVSSGPGVEESSGSGAALSEMAALAAVLMATSLAVVALGAGARRKD